MVGSRVSLPEAGRPNTSPAFPMPLGPAALRRFVRHTLVAATGVATPDASQIASSYDRLCDSLRARLYPLFGVAAIDALFARGLHLAAADFPWLKDVLPT